MKGPTIAATLPPGWNRDNSGYEADNLLAHSLENLAKRGATHEEVEQAIRLGEQVPAKKGRVAFRKHFPFGAEWKGRFYETKQVIPIVAEEPDEWVVVTVYFFFMGGAR